MKFLLIPLAFVAGSALACPADDGSKDAMAPTSSKPALALSKPAPAATPAQARATVAPKAYDARLAVKAATEPRKNAPL